MFPDGLELWHLPLQIRNSLDTSVSHPSSTQMPLIDTVFLLFYGYSLAIILNLLIGLRSLYGNAC